MAFELRQQTFMDKYSVVQAMYPKTLTHSLVLHALKASGAQQIREAHGHPRELLFLPAPH